MGTTEATLRMENLEVKDEWQDEDFPRPLPEYGDMDPSCGLTDDRNSKALCCRTTSWTPPDDLDINVDDMDTPDETDSLEFITNGNELEWEDDAPVASAKAAPASGPLQADEGNSGRLWRTVVIGEQEHRIDMQIIRPYLRVISHGGYYGEGLNAIIVFSACYLPDSSCSDYHYIMENLFLYVVSSLEMLVAEDYLIIYMNGATPRNKMPGIGWLKRCYQMIDRRLRKNLKSLVIAHPTWFIRTVLAISRPFISVKFMNKIHTSMFLECVVQFDEERIKARRERMEQEHRQQEQQSVPQEPIKKSERPKSMVVKSRIMRTELCRKR
ncbi:hypothetical protein JOQ06_019478 [Pogonophryne albipinna]|uniref:CRAL-TRIO domain-containing protein n=1 Tax=Pogonophryne albipinna TaxID=1090488 RepID=A0AAD6A504_9TELE|nr:hypothetical protein JOQ06_019478 [Pogonophryne albipinna]